LRLQEEGAFDADESAACIAEIRAFLTTLPAFNQLWVHYAAASR